MNHKSFVFGSSNPLVNWVLPSIGKFHIYLDHLGQINVIDHAGQLVEQSFGGGSGNYTEGTNIDIVGNVISVTANPVFGGNVEFGGTASFFGGASFSLAGPVTFEDGLTSTSTIQVAAMITDGIVKFTPLSTLPPPEEGRMFYSAGTGMYICTGSTNSTWRRVLTF